MNPELVNGPPIPMATELSKLVHVIGGVQFTYTFTSAITHLPRWKNVRTF